MTKEELEKGAKEYCEEKKHYRYIADGIIQDYIAKTKAEPREKRIAELEKENAELRNRNQELLKSCEGATMMYKDLCKAKELLNEFLDFESSCMERGIYISDKIRAEAEQFLRNTDIDNAIQQANEGLDFDKIADEMEQDLKENE